MTENGKKERISQKEKVRFYIEENESAWWEMTPAELRELLHEFQRKQVTREEELCIIKASREKIQEILDEISEDEDTIIFDE